MWTATRRLFRSLLSMLELGIAVPQLLIERDQFFVRRLKLLLGRFQLLIGALQLLVARKRLFAGRFHLLLSGFVFGDQGTHVFPHGGQFPFQAGVRSLLPDSVAVRVPEWSLRPVAFL